MSLISCPECGHEVSTGATACPNCGHPFAKPVVQRNVVVADTPVTERGLPTWAFAVMGIVGVLLLFGVLVFMTRNNNDNAENRTVNVNLASKRTVPETKESVKTPAQTVSVPPATDSQTVSVPSTSSPSSVTTVPASKNVTTIPAENPDKGTVTIDAKISTSVGAVQTVKAEKFYLLDTSLDSILNDANLAPIAGQSLINSFGLSVLYPNKYSEFNRDALNAIKSHIKYNGLTDNSGKAQLKDVKPDSYYLFGVTKAGNGFAVWDSPVTIQAGQNILNLSPQKLTEVEKDNGEEE